MITRREFLIASGALSGGAWVSGELIGAIGLHDRGVPGRAGDVLAGAVSSCPAEPVVMFFDGQLWLDPSGASVAYQAPTVSRAMPSFTDEALHRARGYL